MQQFVGLIYVTTESLDPCICSTRPINSILGLFVVQLFARCSSAWDRTSLSDDCRASNSCASSLCTSGARTDIFPATDVLQGTFGRLLCMKLWTRFVPQGRWVLRLGSRSVL